MDGLNAYEDAVVDLHGTKTSIHSNYQYGIAATKNAKVNIHLPCYHTVGYPQRQKDGGSIANMNA
jgi:fibronectin type 3 domain-containing protein